MNITGSKGFDSSHLLSSVFASRVNLVAGLIWVMCSILLLYISHDKYKYYSILLLVAAMSFAFVSYWIRYISNRDMWIEANLFANDFLVLIGIYHHNSGKVPVDRILKYTLPSLHMEGEKTLEHRDIPSLSDVYDALWPIFFNRTIQILDTPDFVPSAHIEYLRRLMLRFGFTGLRPTP